MSRWEVSWCNIRIYKYWDGPKTLPRWGCAEEVSPGSEVNVGDSVWVTLAPPLPQICGAASSSQQVTPRTTSKHTYRSSSSNDINIVQFYPGRFMARLHRYDLLLQVQSCQFMISSTPWLTADSGSAVFTLTTLHTVPGCRIKMAEVKPSWADLKVDVDQTRQASHRVPTWWWRHRHYHDDNGPHFIPPSRAALSQELPAWGGKYKNTTYVATRAIDSEESNPLQSSTSWIWASRNCSTFITVELKCTFNSYGVF